MELPRLDRRMLLATLVTGLGAGLGGVGLTLLLHGIQHLAFGYTEDTFLRGVERASYPRRVIAVGVGGLVTGSLWWFQRSRVRTDVSVPRALREQGRGLPFLPSILDSVIQITAVGAGASLGREGAPRLFGSATGAWIARRAGLTEAQRRTVIACGAGAGLAAVYNVPLGGALFSMEVLLGSFALVEAAPALLAAAIATVVAWPVLGDHPTYQVPELRLSAPVVVWSLVLGPLAGLVAAAFRAATRRAQRDTPRGWRVALGVTVTFTALGAAAIAYPELLGNGKGATQVALAGTVGAGTMGALILLKPLATTACLVAGARGGLLTPSLATGAVLGGATGLLWSHLWAGGQTGAYALIGGAAVLAATQRAPVTAVVLAIELTHAGLSLAAPMLVAVSLALGVGTLVADRERLSDLPLVRRAVRKPVPAGHPG